jgi:hypothetical protein
VISGSIDSRVLVFISCCLATGLLFGLVPALRSTKPNLAPTLKDTVGAVVGGSGVRLRKGLVIAQVTVGPAADQRGAVHPQPAKPRTLDLGLKTENLIAFNLSPTLNGYVAALEAVREAGARSRQRGAGRRRRGVRADGLLEGNEWDSSMSVEG